MKTVTRTCDRCGAEGASPVAQSCETDVVWDEQSKLQFKFVFRMEVRSCAMVGGVSAPIVNREDIDLCNTCFNHIRNSLFPHTP